ncbi:aromatic amino acid lyase [Kaistia granuli]|uniref:aromatic amino acid lyase n=1 Tax=Kaistia granuli TaxID=363259 RepID=UPI0018DB38B2|nr:aromatic amino acid lyase [Kaistia granuli]
MPPTAEIMLGDATGSQRDTVILDGSPLRLSTLSLIGRGLLHVVPCEVRLVEVQNAYEAVRGAVEGGRPLYGVTTGVGAIKDRAVALATSADRTDLVRAHHFGVGEPLAPEIVRAGIAIRVNTALSGMVGCSPDLVRAYVAALDADIVPVVRRLGSIGAADIGLMSQVATALAGEGQVFHRGVLKPAEVALREAGLTPHVFRLKDALSAVSTNALTIASAGATLIEAAQTVRVAMATGSSAAAALRASPEPWRVAVRIGSPREAAAGTVLTAVAEAFPWTPATHLHDPLSLRMMAQIFGASAGVVAFAAAAVEAATARPDDNPVVIDGIPMTSGGSLPLELALTLQSVGPGLAHLARNILNRIVLIANGGRGLLPTNLVSEATDATGFGPLVKLAGDLASRVMAELAPVSAMPLLIAGGMEDEAMFAPLIVERLNRQITALRMMTAIEALLAAQGLDMQGLKPTGLVAIVHGSVRSEVAFLDKDRALSLDIETIERNLFQPALLETVRNFYESITTDELIFSH